jgi:hypothetical protein
MTKLNERVQFGAFKALLWSLSHYRGIKLDHIVAAVSLGTPESGLEAWWDETEAHADLSRQGRSSEDFNQQS